jgi:hypothetical protein
MAVVPVQIQTNYLPKISKSFTAIWDFPFIGHHNGEHLLSCDRKVSNGGGRRLNFATRWRSLVATAVSSL